MAVQLISGVAGSEVGVLPRPHGQCNAALPCESCRHPTAAAAMLLTELYPPDHQLGGWWTLLQRPAERQRRVRCCSRLSDVQLLR